jgi:hypothetical protein
VAHELDGIQKRRLDMIDLLNRIGFKQIAFGGDSGGGGGGGGSDPGSGVGDDGWGGWDDTANWGQDDSNDFGNNDNDGPSASEIAAANAAADLAAANAARDKAAAEAKAAAAYDPYDDSDLYGPGGYDQSYSGADYGGQSDEDTLMSQPVTYTGPAPTTNIEAVSLPNDRNFDWDYGPTPFEGPATDDDLGLTDAPISDYSNTEDTYSPNLMDAQTDDDLGFDTYDDTDIFDTDPYSPNLMDAQTDDDLGFETPLDTTDIFGPEVDLLQDPVTGYVRPMTNDELVQGAFNTRMSYAAPDNVLDPNIGTLDPNSFSTGATITGPSPTDTANAYNFDNIAGVDPNTDTTDFNIGGFDTGPNVDTTAPSGLLGSTDLLGDPINLGAVSPTGQSGMGVEIDSTTPNAGFTNTPGVGTETPSVTGASPSGYNSLEDASNYNQSFDPTDPTGFVSPADTTKYDDKTVSTTTVSPTDLSNVYDFYNESAANPLSLELTDPASGLDYADGSPNNIAIDDAVASIAIGRDLDNADEPVLDPDTGKPMLTDKGKPITYGVAPRFSGGGFAGFIQDLISYVVKGATYGVIDINKMDEKYKQKLWDAYQAGGTWAYDEEGKIVGITDENGKLLNIGGGGAVENDGNGGDGTGIVNVCEPGYVLVNGVCVPEDGASTGADDGYGGTFGGPIIRPTTPTTPRTPVVTQPTLPAPTIRAPKQFAMGGEVSPGLVTAADRFLASLKG